MLWHQKYSLQSWKRSLTLLWSLSTELGVMLWTTTSSSCFCDDFGSEDSVLVFHMEVCWLSRGRALMHFFKLQEAFLPREMESQEFNQMLAYFSDMFTHMNDLSASIQGKTINMLKCCKNLNAFKIISLALGIFQILHHLKKWLMTRSP